MKEVVELRIHGVGGTPPEHLLGVSVSDIVRIGGEAESAFYARRDDRSVEGYSWGALTSKPLLQPLWIFLLPFTLMNVAGWMLPRPPRAWGWRLARLLVTLLGLSLTVSYVFGLSSIVIKQVFVQSGLLGWIEDDHVALPWGAVAMLAIGAATGFIADTTQKRFERVATAPSNEPHSYLATLFTQTGNLSEPQFWKNSRAARHLLISHALIGVAALGLYVVSSWADLGPNAADLNVRRLFWILGAVQYMLVTLLFLACLAGFKKPFTTFLTSHFRAFAPIIATSTAFGLAGGFVAGLSIVVGKPLQKVGEFREDVVVGGPELEMNVAFGFGMLTFSLCVLVFLGVVFFWWRSREKKRIRRTRQPPVNTEDNPAKAPNGIPATMLGRLARVRALARGLRHIDILLTIPALPFAAVAFIVLINLVRNELLRNEGMEGYAFLLRWVPKLGWLDRPVLGLKPAYLSDAGGWIAALLVGLVLGRLVQNYLKPEERRLIGILWDVLAFWPRRFHPLGVRPYSERAVPELEGRLRFHLGQSNRRVLLSAHSQGSILAFAALSQIATTHPQLLRRVSLLTYGSPLSRLHANFFPGYFGRDAFSSLEGKLFRGRVSLCGRNAPAAASWFNFYKETDYIGREVEVGDLDAHNMILADPPDAPQPPGDLTSPFVEPPDDPLPAWVQLAMHSHYNRHLTVKEWVRKVKALLGQ